MGAYSCVSDRSPSRHFIQLAREAIRSLLKSPLTTTLCVFITALGLSVNVVVASMLDSMLFAAPPQVRAAHLIRRLYLTEYTQAPAERADAFSYPQFAELVARRDAWSALAGFHDIDVPFGIGSDSYLVRVEAVTPDYFQFLQVPHSAGRYFVKSGEAQPVAVLSDALAIHVFGSPRDAVGKVVFVRGEPFVVVGVAPERFRGIGSVAHVDLWLPINFGGPLRLGSHWREDQRARWLQVVARPAPDVTPLRAAVLSSVALSGQSGTKVQISTEALSGIRSDDGARPLSARVSVLLACVAVAVLAISCANVGNLLLLRRMQRGRELATRMALGMTLIQLKAMLVIEAAILVSAGAILGSLGAERALSGAHAYAILGDAPIEGVFGTRTGLFIALVSILAIGLIGLTLSARMSDRDVMSLLRETNRLGPGKHGRRMQDALVVCQISLTSLLLVFAGLFGKSLVNAMHIDLGFEPERLAIAKVQLLPGASPADWRGAYTLALTRVNSMPSVSNAAMALSAPFQIGFGADLHTPDPAAPTGMRSLDALVNGVSAQYFRTLKATIIRGRALNATDVRGTAMVALVNEALATHLGGLELAMGRCLLLGSETGCLRVVGVVRDIRQESLTEPAEAEVYVPIDQHPTFGLPSVLLLRLSRDGSAADYQRVKDAIATAVPQVLSVDLRPMNAFVDPQLRPWRLGTKVLAVLAAIALMISVAGVYTITMVRVRQRKHELAVRLALGATGASLWLLVMRSVLQWFVLSTLIGFSIFWVLARYAAPLLFHTSIDDTSVLGAVLGAMLAAAVAGGMIPATKACKHTGFEGLRVN